MFPHVSCFVFHLFFSILRNGLLLPKPSRTVSCSYALSASSLRPRVSRYFPSDTGPRVSSFATFPPLFRPLFLGFFFFIVGCALGGSATVVVIRLVKSSREHSSPVLMQVRQTMDDPSAIGNRHNGSHILPVSRHRWQIFDKNQSTYYRAGLDDDHISTSTILPTFVRASWLAPVPSTFSLAGSAFLSDPSPCCRVALVTTHAHRKRFVTSLVMSSTPSPVAEPSSTS